VADHSPEPHSGQTGAGSKVRASHEDRAAIAGMLRDAAAAGRLEPDELDERTAAALSARTLGDLAALVDDLPGEPPLDLSRPEPPPHRDHIESELYGAKRDGPWTVPAELDVRVNGGNIVLDFTEARLTSPTLAIDARVRGGSLTLITRPGIDVHTHDLMVDNGSVKIDTPWREATSTGPTSTGPTSSGVTSAEAAPTVLTVTVTGTIAVGELIARPPRRNLREWLRGDPRPYTTGP
jgi:hypothetical protein